jgi:hypothetical protein
VAQFPAKYADRTSPRGFLLASTVARRLSGTKPNVALADSFATAGSRVSAAGEHETHSIHALTRKCQFCKKKYLRKNLTALFVFSKTTLPMQKNASDPANAPSEEAI